MKKRVLSLTVLVLIGLSSTFGATFSAESVVTNEESNLESVTEVNDTNLGDVTSDNVGISTYSDGVKYYEGARYNYQNKYCPDVLEGHSITVTGSKVAGGSLHYGCYESSDYTAKPWTEYHKETSSDYQAYTVTPAGTKKGDIKSHDKLSKHAEHSMNSGGMVYYKVKIFD